MRVSPPELDEDELLLEELLEELLELVVEDDVEVAELLLDVLELDVLEEEEPGPPPALEEVLVLAPLLELEALELVEEDELDAELADEAVEVPPVDPALDEEPAVVPEHPRLRITNPAASSAGNLFSTVAPSVRSPPECKPTRDEREG